MTAEPRSAMDPRQIRAVAFDGYGTLFNYDLADFKRDVAVILAQQGIETDFDAFFHTWSHAFPLSSVWGDRSPSRERPHDDHVLNGPLPGWHSSWEIWRRQFIHAFETHGLSGDADAGADYLRGALSHAATYPDAHETIEALAGRRYLLGLLSNADEDFLQSALSRGRLRFSVIQSSESLRAYKPHRAIFTALCDRLGCEPGEVLYVGDSPIADVNGARNAGLRTAMIRREESEYPEDLLPPDLVLDRLTDLLGTLEQAPGDAS